MRNTKLSKTIQGGVVLFLVMWVVYACTKDDTCVVVGGPKVNIGFYIIVDGVETDTTLQVFSADGNVVNDSNLYDSVSINKISVPLSQLNDSCSFTFRFNQVDTLFVPDSSRKIDSIIFATLDTIFVIDQITPDGDTIFEYEYYNDEVYDTTYWYDKVSFEYQRSLGLISEECGYRYDFVLDTVYSTHVRINRVQIVDTVISTSDAENVKIYF